MKTTTFYIGTNVGKTQATAQHKAGTAIVASDVTTAIRDIFSKYHKSYTYFWATGAWKTELEETLIVQVMGDTTPTDAIVEDIKHFLMQDTVMIVEEEKAVSFR